jgi:uncharacterized coiled-coil protein SlyX
MGKLLRVVVIIILVLSGVALWFGISLFGKREELKGRAQKFETTVLKLGPYIEKDMSGEAPAKDFPSRDIDECKAEVLDSPKKSDFWDKYRIELEVADQPKLELDKKRMELKSYYKVGFDGKREKDQMGQYVTSGDGTLQGVLDELEKKTAEQYTRLIDTRAQLKSLREEYVLTVKDLNQQKTTLRTKLKDILDLQTKISDLEAKIPELEAKIKDLDGQVAAAKTDVDDKSKQIEQLNATIAMKDADVARLDKRVKDLVGATKTPGSPSEDIAPSIRIEPGQKGTVTAVDGKWNFVLINVDDAFMKEMLGEKLDNIMPLGVDLNISRPGNGGTFVTKVRVMSIRKNEKLAVADILSNWQQAKVQEGDVVYY